MKIYLLKYSPYNEDFLRTYATNEEEIKAIAIASFKKSFYDRNELQASVNWEKKIVEVVCDDEVLQQFYFVEISKCEF